MMMLMQHAARLCTTTTAAYSFGSLGNTPARRSLRIWTLVYRENQQRPGAYYWRRTSGRAQSSSPGGSTFNVQSKTSSTKNDNPPSRLRTLPFFSYFRKLKWFPIPLSLGFALLAYQHYRRVLTRAKQGQKTIQEEHIHRDWEITCYRTIPWRALSRTWGWMNNITLPEWSRSYVLGWYASAFQCDLEEAETDNLKYYNNLGEFFRRNLKSGIRPIDPCSSVVSPADGQIFHAGKVDCGVIEQVKGVRYSLHTFLGPLTWTKTSSLRSEIISSLSPTSNFSDTTTVEYCSQFMKDSKTHSLFYCVVYLAPGDYHRFHSPADWVVKFRRHFGGELLSVNPSVANWIGGLFSLNERAVYIGDWEHGFFSMTAVGATNVGSIKVYDDPTLQTNVRSVQKNSYEDLVFDNPIKLKKGDCFGEFNLGSTIVLIFEAPHDFRFSLGQCRRVKVGRGLACDVQKQVHVGAKGS